MLLKIYVDLVLLLNLFFDFLLLFTTNYILKRNKSFLKILLGSIVGSLSILLLFIKISSLELFLLKIVISIVMILTTFSFKNIVYFFKNVSYLYLISIVLGGGLYLLNINFSYKNTGLIFFHKGVSINIIFMFLASLIIIYLYGKEYKSKSKITNLLKVDIYFKGKKYNYCGYLDTGNTLQDPYKKRSVIILYSNKIKATNFVYVPYQTLNNTGIIKCIKVDKVDKVVINNKKFKDILIGISNDKFRIEGIDCILPNKIREEL